MGMVIPPYNGYMMGRYINLIMCNPTPSGVPITNKQQKSLKKSSSCSQKDSPPESNSSHLKMVLPKRKGLSSNDRKVVLSTCSSIWSHIIWVPHLVRENHAWHFDEKSQHLLPSLGTSAIREHTHLQVAAFSWFTTGNILSIQPTPPKFNIAPEKLWLEDYFPVVKVTFQGRGSTSGG